MVDISVKIVMFAVAVVWCGKLENVYVVKKEENERLTRTYRQRTDKDEICTRDGIRCAERNRERATRIWTRI